MPIQTASASAEGFGCPTREETTRFLVSFLFNGSMSPGLEHCVWRAYLDFCRTAHGISRGKQAESRKAQAHTRVRDLLEEVTNRQHPWTCATYDLWHRTQCARLHTFYAERGFARLTVGQAQKWLNMAVKYALALHRVGLLLIRHAEPLNTVAHVPLDDILLKGLRPYGLPPLNCPWSRIQVYAEYMRVQEWIRERFQTQRPLDVEFHLWARGVSQREPA